MSFRGTVPKQSRQTSKYGILLEYGVPKGNIELTRKHLLNSALTSSNHSHFLLEIAGLSLCSHLQITAQASKEKHMTVPKQSRFFGAATVIYEVDMNTF